LPGIVSAPPCGVSSTIAASASLHRGLASGSGAIDDTSRHEMGQPRCRGVTIVVRGRVVVELLDRRIAGTYEVGVDDPRQLRNVRREEALPPTAPRHRNPTGGANARGGSPDCSATPRNRNKSFSVLSGFSTRSSYRTTYA